MSEYFISTDRNLLNVEFIVCSLQSTYWAGSRTRDEIVESMKSSLCFGIFVVEDGDQVGFARVVTDGVTFSWICDVFVDPKHRTHGLGKRLVSEIIAHPRVILTRSYLGTRDAHGLYEKFGFERWELMRRASAPLSPPMAGSAGKPMRRGGF